MDKDRPTGVLIVLGVIVVGILYFGSFVIPWWSFLTAVKVVVSAGFLALLGIGGWIGWTMASAQSPEPVEDLNLEDIEDFDEDFEEGIEEEAPEA